MSSELIRAQDTKFCSSITPYHTFPSHLVLAPVPVQLCSVLLWPVQLKTRSWAPYPGLLRWAQSYECLYLPKGPQKASSNEKQRVCYQYHHEVARFEYSGLIWKLLLLLRTLSAVSNIGKWTCSSFVPLCNQKNSASIISVPKLPFNLNCSRTLLLHTESHINWIKESSTVPWSDSIKDALIVLSRALIS